MAIPWRYIGENITPSVSFYQRKYYSLRILLIDDSDHAVEIKEGMKFFFFFFFCPQESHMFSIVFVADGMVRRPRPNRTLAASPPHPATRWLACLSYKIMCWPRGKKKEK
jgi:hypothetical protein